MITEDILVLLSTKYMLENRLVNHIQGCYVTLERKHQFLMNGNYFIIHL